MVQGQNALKFVKTVWTTPYETKMSSYVDYIPTFLRKTHCILGPRPKSSEIGKNHAGESEKPKMSSCVEYMPTFLCKPIDVDFYFFEQLAEIT